MFPDYLSVSYDYDKSEKSFNQKNNNKKKIGAVKNIFPLDFAKYPNFSKVRKNNKVVNV